MRRPHSKTKQPKPKAVLHKQDLAPWQKFLPNALIRKWCRELRYRCRERHWPPLRTLWACTWKQAAAASARKVEDRQALGRAPAALPQRRGSAFCTARARLPLPLFQKAVRHVGHTASAKAAQYFRGLRVTFFDGSSSLLARTKANLAAFQTPKNQHGAGRFPMLRWVLLLCAGSGAALDVACGAYTTGEMRLWLELLETLPPNLLCVGDRLFGNFTSLARTQARGSHALCRLHVNRRAHAVRCLGRHDEIHLWSRPQPRHVCAPELLAALPETLEVRVLTRTVHHPGYRDSKLILVTTLCDHQLYPGDALAELYLQRWEIEGHLRTLKTAHGLDRLATRTPATVQREFFSAFLAYNGVRAALAESGGHVRRLSHTRALELMLLTAERLTAAAPAKRQKLLQELWALLAQVLAPLQKRPPEPRALVRQKSHFPILLISRAAFHRKHPAA